MDKSKLIIAMVIIIMCVGCDMVGKSNFKDLVENPSNYENKHSEVCGILTRNLDRYATNCEGRCFWLYDDIGYKILIVASDQNRIYHDRKKYCFEGQMVNFKHTRPEYFFMVHKDII